MAGPPTPADGETLAPKPIVPSADPAPTDANELLIKVLGVLGAGIGVLGFVTFVGGVIIWARADKAGLPAAEAVAVVPNAVLVTTGATHLVSAILIALLAVGLIFIVHVWNRFWRERRAHDRRQQAEVLDREADQLEREAAAAAQPAEAARKLAFTLQEAVTQAQASGGSVDVDALESQAGSQLQEAERLCQTAVDATALATAKRAEAENEKAAVEVELERSENEYKAELLVGLFILLIVPSWVKGAIFHVPFVPYGIGLILVAILVPLISLFTYVETKKFLWFGVAAFVTVGLYIGFSSYSSTRGNPKMQPVAALRMGHVPVTGVFVADTGDNMYIGSFSEDGRPARLVVIPRSQLTEVVIGPLLEPEIAQRRSIQMALDECDQEVEVPSENVEVSTSMGKGEVTQACSEAQVKTLAEAARQLDQPG